MSWLTVLLLVLEHESAGKVRRQKAHRHAATKGRRSAGDVTWTSSRPTKDLSNPGPLVCIVSTRLGRSKFVVDPGAEGTTHYWVSRVRETAARTGCEAPLRRRTGRMVGNREG